MKSPLSFFMILMICLTGLNIESVNANGIESIDPEVDKFNITLMELDEKVRNLLGPKGSIGSIGHLTVNEKGEFHINLKRNIKSIYNNNQAFHDLLDWAEKENITIATSITYSAEELTKILDEIFADIKRYYDGQIPTDLNFSIIQNDIAQKIELTQDASRKNRLDKNLVQLLEEKYSGVFTILKEVELPKFTFLKGKASSWNKLGEGLAVPPQSSLNNCLTMAMLYKDTEYFHLTASHCFSGSVFPSRLRYHLNPY